MGRKPDYVDNALAERDAEIERLRQQVENLQGDLEYRRNYAAAAFAQQRELIDMLRQQVAELQAELARREEAEYDAQFPIGTRHI